MLYSNSSEAAISACERSRTGNYGNDDEAENYIGLGFNFHSLLLCGERGKRVGKYGEK